MSRYLFVVLFWALAGVLGCGSAATPGPVPAPEPLPEQPLFVPSLIESKGFPAAKYGHGELKYIGKVPVLVLRGTPAEMGEQFGILAVKNAPDLDGLTRAFLKDAGQTDNYSLLQLQAARLKGGFPPHHAVEIEAAARAAGRDLSFHWFANTLADLSSGLGCSTVVVEKQRSVTGTPLLGRNFDWLPSEGITEHTLVVVYQGQGKRAFAAITVSPIQGVISGMNDAGLCVTINEISIKQCKDRSKFNWKGTPLLLCFRRVLEECATVEEAERLVRAMGRTTCCCMTICDRNGGAVFEISPQNLEVRTHTGGVICCTNHFRTEKLCMSQKCWRYDKLSPLLDENSDKLDVSDVFDALRKVDQGKWTLQSMVFDPTARMLHLAYGPGEASKRPPWTLNLGALFDDK